MRGLKNVRMQGRKAQKSLLTNICLLTGGQSAFLYSQSDPMQSAASNYRPQQGSSLSYPGKASDVQPAAAEVASATQDGHAGIASRRRRLSGMDGMGWCDGRQGEKQ